MMPIISVTERQVQETLDHLQLAGRRGSECVVLWIGRRREGLLVVEKIHMPAQCAGRDYFRIPSASIRALLESLCPTRSLVVAQVHSHPGLAFHWLFRFLSG